MLICLTFKQVAYVIIISCSSIILCKHPILLTSKSHCEKRNRTALPTLSACLSLSVWLSLSLSLPGTRSYTCHWNVTSLLLIGPTPDRSAVLNGVATLKCGCTCCHCLYYVIPWSLIRIFNKIFHLISNRYFGAFANLWKANERHVSLSACLSFHMEQFGSHGTDFN